MSFFLCLDIGAKKVGIAVSDRTANFARDLKMIPFKRLEDELQNLITEFAEIEALVIGLPLKQGKIIGEAAEKIMKIGHGLEKKFNLPVYFEDERLTSWDAREILKEMGYKPDKIKELEDQVAAKLILQAFLSRLHNNFQD